MPRQGWGLYDPFPEVVEPRYFVELEFSPDDILRFNNTSEERSFQSQYFYPWSFALANLNINRVGKAECTLNFDNTDRTLGVEFLIRSSANRKGRVWLEYQHWGRGQPPILLIDGWLDGCQVDDRVQLNIVSTTLHRGGAPRLTFAPPLFNHLPGSGFWFRWNDQNYEIVRR